MKTTTFYPKKSRRHAVSCRHSKGGDPPECDLGDDFSGNVGRDLFMGLPAMHPGRVSFDAADSNEKQSVSKLRLDQDTILAFRANSLITALRLTTPQGGAFCIAHGCGRDCLGCEVARLPLQYRRVDLSLSPGLSRCRLFSDLRRCRSKRPYLCKSSENICSQVRPLGRSSS